MTDETKHDDLAWLAFCYIADELSAEECARFEERLAVDQAAREALATAVELTTVIAESLTSGESASDLVGSARAVNVLSRSESRRSSRKWLERVAWTACGAAACWLLLSLSGAIDMRKPDGRAKDTGASDGALGELAANWAELLEENPSEDEAGAIATGAVEADDLPVEDVDGASDWMVAALAEEEMESSDEEHPLREAEGA